MSVSSRMEIKAKKGEKNQKKKTEDLSRISSSHSEMDEKMLYKVIDGDDLIIKDEDLKKLTKEKLKPLEKDEPIMVKKINEKAFPTTEIKVAKLAPKRNVVNVDYGDNLGIRFDHYGNCVHYSILGTVEDYLKEAVTNRKSIQIPYDVVDSDSLSADMYLKPDESQTNKENSENDGGKKALKNWNKRINERSLITKLVSKKSNRNEQELVMNRSDNFDKKLKIDLIERTLPLVENGKGFRLGSEFWNQPLLIGNETNGIFTSLKKSERGLLPDIEVVAKPSVTVKETHFNPNQPNLNSYPWSKSKYLEQRLNKLEPIINEIMPFKSEMDNLQIVGTNPSKSERINYSDTDNSKKETDTDTWINQELPVNYNSDIKMNMNASEDALSCYENVTQSPFFGPSIIFGGQRAAWSGLPNDEEFVLGLESRLNFETKAGKRVLGTFEIFNDGTCAIKYDWRKIKSQNPFNIHNPKIQRFYFDTRSSFILPGESLKLHVVFKSTSGGIFTESWEFITKPKLVGGASLVLTLRGVAIIEDKFKKSRISLEKKLFSREAEIIAKSMIELILSGVKTPERPSSPQNLSLIEETQFLDTNKSHNLFYDQEAVLELKNFYNTLSKESDQSQDWNLSLDALKEKINSIQDDDANRQGKLLYYNNYMEQLSLKSYIPNTSKVYSICYNTVCLTIDEIFNELKSLSHFLNYQIPVNTESFPSYDQYDANYEAWKKEFEIIKQYELEKKTRQEKEKSKDTKAKKGDKKEEKKKDKKAISSTPGGAKSRNSRELVSRNETRSQEKSFEEKERDTSPIVLTEVQLKNRKLFHEKAYFNVYQILVNMCDNLESIFELVAENPISKSIKSANSQTTPSLNCDFID